MKLIIVDTETGGLNPKEESMLTVAMVAVDVDVVTKKVNIIDKLHLPCKHEKYIVKKEAMEVNKINLEAHDIIALDKAVLLSRMQDFIKVNGCSKVPICGQNIDFDIGFLKEYCGSNYPFYFKKLELMNIWIACKLAGKVPQELPDNLKTMALQLDINYSGAHDALTDCLITAQALEKLMQLLSK